ncbi:MAG: hypothetical protein M3Y68_11765 [Chloroflexota bacterium]|nr:hypothetical protein [Chloroflexota bacterium]
MYLLSELEIVPLLFLLLLWGISGWLLTLRWFDLELHERGFVGFGMGMIFSNWIANLLVRFLPITVVFWASAGLTLALGLFSAWPLTRQLIVPLHRVQWLRWLLFAGAVALFTLIGRGMGMFDDYHNLPTTSLMATGDIPPHLPGAPDVRYGYHYFLMLIGVQFMRVASAPPWTALDLARGLILALALVYVCLLAWRLTRNKFVVWLSAAFYAFATGTRWLLLFLPASLLDRISSSITLLGSGRDTAPDFSQALSQPWNAIGSGPIPFPFAFVNGVHDLSIMAHYGYGVSAGLIMLLLLLLAGRQMTWKAGVLFIALVASLALANEVDFGMFCLGALLVGIYWAIRNKSLRPPRSAWFWIIVIVLAGMLVLLQGGFLTEFVRIRLLPEAAQAESYFTAHFFLIPPAVIAAHLGKMSLFNPQQLLAALFEVGPLILAAPLVLSWGHRALRAEQWIQAALAVAVIPSLLSVFVEYSGNADITATTRFLSIMLFLCKILGIPLLWLWLRDQPEWKHTLAYGLIAMTMFAGIVLFAIQLVAVPRPVHAVFITDMDARFYERYWDRLSPPDAWVFDPGYSRSQTIFGRQADSLARFGVFTPEFLTLVENPDPYQLNAAGYSYLYADKDYWKEYDAQLAQPCIRVMETVEGARQTQAGSAPDFRQLADISDCR